MRQEVGSKQLREFGWLVGGVFIIIGIWPMLVRGEPLRLWVLGPGAVLMIAGTVLPASLMPIFKGWMWIGHVLGWINTRILLGIVFYGLITPIGIVFRLIGKDAMKQAFEESSPTYRVICKPRHRGHMKFQF